MKLNLKYLSIVLLGGTLVFSSCTKHPDSPGYEYVPDMYRSQAVEAYVDYGLVGDDERGERALRLKNTQSARTPVEGTIPFQTDAKMAALMMPLSYGLEDAEKAGAEWKLPAMYMEDVKGNLKEGKRLYGIFCQHCHGAKGMGDGGVVEVGDFNRPNPYSGGYKDRSLGSIFHTITYGKGAMGAHGSQLNKNERWKVAMYVRELQHGEFVAEEVVPVNDSIAVVADTTGL